jgi:hypothetical protein
VVHAYTLSRECVAKNSNQSTFKNLKFAVNKQMKFASHVRFHLVGHPRTHYRRAKMPCHLRTRVAADDELEISMEDLPDGEEGAIDVDALEDML